MGEEDYYDFESDTAECSFCGNYYCMCCGCDCMFEDMYVPYTTKEAEDV